MATHAFVILFSDVSSLRSNNLSLGTSKNFPPFFKVRFRSVRRDLF